MKPSDANVERGKDAIERALPYVCKFCRRRFANETFRDLHEECHEIAEKKRKGVTSEN